MKVKKLAALALACAVVAAGGAIMAACNGNGENDDDKKGGFVEDTRIWYAVGDGEKGTIKDRGEDAWKPQVVVDSLKFTRDTTKTDENVFTLKMDIYAGEVVKFIYKKTADETFASDDDIWPRQVGIHEFDTVSGEGDSAVIKSGEDILFTTKGGMDANNLYCAKGQDGKYIFTLKTFPEQGAEEKVVLSVTKDEKISIPYDMYVYGDMNAFGWKDKIDYAMTSSNGVWSYMLNVTAEDLTRDATGATVKTGAQYAAVQLVNEGEGAAAGDAKKFALAPAEGDTFLKVTDKTNGEVNLLPEGQWVITFTENGKVVSFVQSTYEMYFRGSGTGMTWSDCDANYKLNSIDNGKYWTGYLTVSQEDITANQKVSFKLFNKLYKTGDGWYGNGSDNIDLTEAGVYAVKFTVETGAIDYEKVGYHVVGAYGTMDNNSGWENGLKAGKATALVDKGEGVYSADVEFVANNEFKVVAGTALCGVYNGQWYGAADTDPLYVSGGNFKITEAGTYTVTATVSGESVTITAVKKA